jgi:hypothetical protein
MAETNIVILQDGFDWDYANTSKEKIIQNIVTELDVEVIAIFYNFVVFNFHKRFILDIKDELAEINVPFDYIYIHSSNSPDNPLRHLM